MDLSRFSSLCSSEPYLMPYTRSSSLTDMMFLGDDMSFAMYALSAQPYNSAVPPLPPTTTSSGTASSSSSSTPSATETEVKVPQQPQPQQPVDLPQRFELDVDPNVFNVEEIIGHKNRAGSRKYLVKWEGWDSRYNSWIDAADFCTDALPLAYEEELKQQRQEARRRRRRRRENASDQAPPQPPRARASKRKAAAVAAPPRVDRAELDRASKRQKRV